MKKEMTTTRKMTTKIWLDDCASSTLDMSDKQRSITVNYSVTDLDEAAKLLGWVDYADLYNDNMPEDEDDSPLNFEHISHE